MTLPGLPPPRRVELPAPAGGAAAARRAARRRQAAALGAALAVSASALAAVTLRGPGGDQPVDRLDGRATTAPDEVREDVMAGRVVDEQGQPVPGLAVLPADLSEVLTRTDEDGRWSVPCAGAVVLSAYAPTTRDGDVRERSPGAGNYAWRRMPERCGELLETVAPEGAVAQGLGTPGQDVRLARVQGDTTAVLPVGPVFVTRVSADGSWRIEGLDTGRYRVDERSIVDLREGQTVTVQPQAG
jgi:hypothetical protein